MENQTADYHGDVYQWNHTASADGGDAETEYYLPNWTDLVLAGLFTILIIVTIVSDRAILEASDFSLVSSRVEIQTLLDPANYQTIGRNHLQHRNGTSLLFIVASYRGNLYRVD